MTRPLICDQDLAHVADVDAPQPFQNRHRRQLKENMLEEKRDVDLACIAMPERFCLLLFLNGRVTSRCLCRTNGLYFHARTLCGI